MQDTVLVVEDEADMVDLLRYNLKKAGLGVVIASDGRTGLEIARKNRPDVVILDILLPQMDGYAVCRALKNSPETAGLPILILTARGGPADRVKGFEIGADDYLAKPFSLRELILRIQALLRRSRQSAQNDVLEVDDFQVDRNSFVIRLEGRRIDVTTTEFKLLAALIERHGSTQSRETLLNEVWAIYPPMGLIDLFRGEHRFQVTKHSQLSVGVQVIFDPGNAAESETVGVFYARLRTSF